MVSIGSITGLLFAGDEDAAAVFVRDVEDGSATTRSDCATDSVGVLFREAGQEVACPAGDVERHPQVHDLAATVGDFDAEMSRLLGLVRGGCGGRGGCGR